VVVDKSSSELRVRDVVVRPIRTVELARFNQNLDDHHWLGHNLTGAVMRYVATIDDRWVALVGFGSSALSCAPRDTWIGWSRSQQFSRLVHIANNQRFCMLPTGRIPNLASCVLSRALKRLSYDYEATYSYPIVAVETFTDPSRHSGSCYKAAGFVELGMTLGYRRSAGAYVHHGNPKILWIKALHSNAKDLLTATFDPQALSRTKSEGQIDLNDIEIASLLTDLENLADPRMRRGVRHSFLSLLGIAALGCLAGDRSYAAIGESAQELPQEALAALSARKNPRTGQYVVPSPATLRRAIMNVDPDGFDRVVSTWQQRGAQATERKRPKNKKRLAAIAVDGKTLRGSRNEDNNQPHLLAAMTHGTGIVIAQREVDGKTNEITQFCPLLENIDLRGKVVTADAMHTQRASAEFLVNTKSANYVLIAKANQPSLVDELESLFENHEEGRFCADHSQTDRGHGRIATRSIQVLDCAGKIDFPHATQAFCLIREVTDLDGQNRRSELVYGITSLPVDRAGPAELNDLVRSHWQIENRLHWVRDVTFDEDRSQIRKGNGPRVMASLRNLAIGVFRIAGETNIARATRSVMRDPMRALALLGICVT